MSYTPLDSGLIHSTVWREPAPTRLVWITMLALADRHDEVMASVPGLADAARVTLEECEVALRRLSEPDPYSRTKEHDGRRIEAIPGGWFILNRQAHRERAQEEHQRALAADRQRRFRERNANALRVTDRNAESRDGTQESHNVNVNVRTTSTPKRRRGANQPEQPASPRLTWLTPYVTTWESKFGSGSCDTLMGQMGKALKRLHGEHGADVVARRLAWYLDNTEPRFVSITRFAQTFSDHNPDAPAFPDEADAEYVT